MNKIIQGIQDLKDMGCTDSELLESIDGAKLHFSSFQEMNESDLDALCDLFYKQDNN